MSAHEFWVSRDLAELMVDLLEDNYKTGKYVHTAGEGADFAVELREKFGMPKQSTLKFREDAV